MKYRSKNIVQDMVVGQEGPLEQELIVNKFYRVLGSGGRVNRKFFPDSGR